MSTATYQVATSLAGVVVGLLVATTLAGCSPSVSIDSGDMITHPAQGLTVTGLSGVDEEYNEATAKYVLPEGVSYPLSPFNDADGQYQVGYGEAQVVAFWNCAWGKSYLATWGVDKAGAAIALEIYASVRDTDTYKLSWDVESIQQPFEAAVEAAELGDPSAIQNDIEINCKQ